MPNRVSPSCHTRHLHELGREWGLTCLSSTVRHVCLCRITIRSIRSSSPVTSTAVIAKMRSLFAEQDVPQRVFSDNGGHFSSDAFRRFADQWCFDHVTSSPHYPQSNGSIERNVQTVKHTLKKVGPRSDVLMALLVLRATPIDSHLPSPEELLYGRRVVSNLPISTRNATGKRCEIRARLDQRQATAREQHDARGVRDLSQLSRGEHVRTRHPVTHRWEPGRIVTPS